MQNYTKIQKTLSFILIFSILFSFTINVAFFGFVGQIFAFKSKHYNLVSIFVQKEVYDNIDSKINNYAKNISQVLDNTKTIILPIPENATPYDILKFNERLYVSGENGIDGNDSNSSLIGSVFIGNIPLPVVQNEGNSQKTIFPYVDFIDKLYIYDELNEVFTLNKEIIESPKAEVWHGFITPNTGDENLDIQKIGDYLDKNNDFYKGQGLFKNENNILNGDETQTLSDNYKPRVFYYDQIREFNSISYVNYKAYKEFLANLEDIVYNRYSKDLANKLKNVYDSEQKSSFAGASEIFNGKIDFSKIGEGMDFQKVPDIQLGNVINKYSKEFVEIFNSDTIGEFRKNVYNAGRYNQSGNSVNVDLIPGIVSNLDIYYRNVLQSANNDLEKEILRLVNSGLARNIAIPTSLSVDDSGSCNTQTYTNFYSGKKASDITSPLECNIYRGSISENGGNLVEANRGYNINNIQGDVGLCLDKTSGRWGGNSPINLDMNQLSNQDYVLKSSDKNKAVFPLFDIAGSVKNTDTNNTPGVLQCLNPNLIKTYQKEYVNYGGGGGSGNGGNSVCEVVYNVPINGGNPVNWSCSSQNQILTTDINFENIYSQLSSGSFGDCKTSNIILDGNSVKSKTGNCYNGGGNGGQGGGGGGDYDEPEVTNYNYKKITSVGVHTSPNSDELTAQVKALVTPSLPIDKDRYVDFIAADNTYTKINFPNFFRLKENDVSKYLNNQTKVINDIISQKDPSKLTPAQKEIYDLLKKGNYPSQIDLDKFLQDKGNLEDVYDPISNKTVKLPVEKITSDLDVKYIRYYEILKEAVYWNNLNSTTAKYGYVLKNYLSDQYQKFNLKFFPKNQKAYEIAYLGAPGDSTSMFIKMDPEEKGENPYADIILKNQQLQNLLFSVNETKLESISSGDNSKCAPPEGVPLTEWIPAVSCRLKDLLPPKIGVADGSCGTSFQDFISYGSVDEDKDGVNDYLLKDFVDGKAVFSSDFQKYYYNKTGILKTTLFNKNDGQLYGDSYSKTRFELVKITDVKENKVVYDKKSPVSDEQDRNISKYINFKNKTLNTTNGEVSTFFNTKSRDSNIEFNAIVSITDSFGKVLSQKQETLNIEIRGDLLFAQSSKLYDLNGSKFIDSGISSVEASDKDNIFIGESRTINIEKSNLDKLGSYSASSEKLFLALDYKDVNGKDLNISYPISVKIFDSQKNIVSQKTYNNLSGVISPISSIKQSGIYNLEIEDKFGFKIKKEFQILPKTANDIVLNLGTKLLEKGGVLTSNVFTLYDEYKNVASGDNYDVKVDISGENIVFEDNTKSKNVTLIEGFKTFRLKSTNINGISTITLKLFKNGKEIKTVEEKIKVVDEIKFDITGDFSDVKVGKNIYNYQINVEKDSEFDFDSRAYLVSNNIYYKSLNDYVKIEKNIGKGTFVTTNKASKDVKLEFKIEGIKKSVFKEINIYPDVALKLDLSLSKSKMEAKNTSRSTLTVVLKDRFGNTVWNDFSSNVKYSTHDKYKNIISPEIGENKVDAGIARFEISGRDDMAGSAFFKVEVLPSLESNFVQVKSNAVFSGQELSTIGMLKENNLSNLGEKLFYKMDDSYRLINQNLGYINNNEAYKTLNPSQKKIITDKLNNLKTISVSGVGQNVGKIETFYAYDKTKIEGNNYNSIYTTLLGASYGDITVKDYLAGSMIFDKNNKSLAVTSLLNDSIQREDILKVNPSGSILINKNASDLARNIVNYYEVNSDGNIEITFVNDTYSEIVSKVIYNLNKNNLDLSRCISTNTLDCFSKEKTSLILKSLKDGYKTQLKNSKLSLLDNNDKEILVIDENGKIISKSHDLGFDLNQNYKDDLVLNLRQNQNLIGVLGISIKDGSINFVREKALLKPVLTSQNKGGIVVYLEEKSYSYTLEFSGNSTDSKKGYLIYSTEIFSSNKPKLDKFSKFFEYGYENFYSQDGIGWSNDNKSLLSFASGEGVGESTKEYQTFSMINIGDPVVNLKSVRKKFSNGNGYKDYDSTIGNLISKDDKNLAFSTLDFNNDGNLDIAILKYNGEVEIIEGNGIGFDKGNIVAQIFDISKDDFIETGDFNGDGYWDIVLLNKNKEIILLDNNQKRISRVDLSQKLNLKGSVINIVADKIDGDSKSDLAIFDDSGEVNIFYGGLLGNSIYTKNITSGKGVVLNSSGRNDNSLIYFDGLYQIPQDNSLQNLKDSKALYNKIGSNLTQLQKADDLQINEDVINKLIFTRLNYSTGNVVLEQNPNTDQLNNNNPNNNLTTFLKTQYGEYQDIIVTKKFKNLTNKTSNILKSKDSVLVEIEVKNVGNTKQNIAFIEKIPELFSINSNPEYKFLINGGEKQAIIKTSPIDGYSFLIDSYKEGNSLEKINLKPSESFKLSFNVQTNSFKYGSIKVGEFDKTDSDKDIIFKTDNKSCGENYDLYFSTTGYRSYDSKTDTLSCNQDFPDQIKKNSIDEDGNNVPDYIDELINNSNNPQKVQDFSKDSLNDIYADKDGDGVSDFIDISPEYNSGENFMNKLDKINQTTDEILSGMDTLIDGFGCGFGGGSCIATPMNWAPLAPGGDPVAFGMPVGDGLKINEGIPVFSMMNWMPIGSPPFCIPMPWPTGGYFAPGCGTPGAGGALGVTNPTNTLRIFVTPTLTGAVGTAICFGQPLVAGMSNPPGAHPMVPGGNCIVVAKPLIGCKNDGSDGDVSSDLIPSVSSNGISLTNGNCGTNTKNKIGPEKYIGDLAGDYFEYQKSGNVDKKSFNDKLDDLVFRGNDNGGGINLPNSPLLSVGNSSDENFSVEVDFDALANGNFEDVMNVSNTRVSAFPDFIMDWVTRQIEEIANKLTSFPTIFVILPDFSGILDSGWNDFSKNIETAFNSGKKDRVEKETKLESQIQKLEAQKASLNCEKQEIACLRLDISIGELKREKSFGGNQTTSGIRSVYQFLSTLPIVNIQPQQVDVNIPWADQATIDKALLEWKLTQKQWEQEYADFKKAVNIDDYTCVKDSTDNSNECKIVLNAQETIESLRKNIEILEGYKKLPEDIHKMLSIKDIRLEQILCNIEAIAQITSGWISQNSKTFKSWVELYVLIKAILKSWQLLVDVFLDFQAECHQCKNERNDMMYYIWKLISAAIPQMPIIQFPKWPDIYIDLHNVRAGLSIFIPDFNFNLRPIVLPNLPELRLPRELNVNISLPALPLLPTIELPTLPELPSLPVVELPNLPPPPTLPRLFASIEGYLNVLKVITKAMCILKTSPFVPEWRAGDQIAFMTERSGYLDLDFLDISLPQFSYPFVDAIKVTSYVNLEFETEFLTEMAQNAVLPLNTFTNNIVNLMNIGIDDIDLTQYVPSNVNINLDPNNEEKIDIGAYNGIKIGEFSKYLALGIAKVYTYVDTNSKIELNNQEFKNEILTQLESKDIIGDQKISEINHIWNDALNYPFTYENEIEKDLLDYNNQKFKTLFDIISKEKEKNQNLMKNLDEKLKNSLSKNILISGEKNDDFKVYNQELSKFNQKTIDNLNNISNTDYELFQIKDSANSLKEQLVQKVNNFSDKLDENQKQIYASNITTNNSNNASTNNGGNIATPNSTQTCSTSGYKFDYKGLYVTKDEKSYRLFDYLDELKGDEKMEISNQEIFYMVGNEIFYKKPVNKVNNKRNLGVKLISNFVNENKNYAMVNSFNQTNIKNNYVNVGFLSPTNKNIRNFNIEVYDVYDKFEDNLNSGDSQYLPKILTKSEIDAFAGYKQAGIDLNKSNESFVIRNNLSYIDTVGNLFGVSLTTNEIKNIKQDIENNLLVTINSNTSLYTANSSTKIEYYYYNDEDKIINNLTIPSYSNINFNKDVVITGLTNDAYIFTGNEITLVGNDIIPYVKKPLGADAKFDYVRSELHNLNVYPYLKLKHYDGTVRNLDFKEMISYKIYDLGEIENDYNVIVDLKNGFYNAKIRGFKNNIYTNYSNKIALSPQSQSDTIAPEISDFEISVPIFTTKTIEITDKIYDESGIDNLKEIAFDFDLNNDTSGDGIKGNDKDFTSKIVGERFKIKMYNKKIFLEVGEFEELITKKIKIFVTDGNNNTSSRDIKFEVTGVKPVITDYKENTIYGKIEGNYKNIPVNLYKSRGGSLQRLIDNNGKYKVEINGDGKFEFNLPQTQTGLTFKGENIEFKVNEFTGKIDISNENKALNNLDINILPSNSKNNEFAYPKITVSKSGEVIYKQYLKVPNVGSVKVENNFGGIKSSGVYYVHENKDFEYFSMPLGLKYNPGDMFVYYKGDESKTPLITIFKDGRINISNELYYLNYSTFGDYVVYEIKQKSNNTIIGKVLIIPEESFTVK